MMMRITTLAFVCAIAGCSWGGESDPSGGGGGVDAAVSATPVCGDGVCAANEVGNCASDCGSGGGNTNPTVQCGNGTCETGETSASCPNDCGGGGGGGGGGGTCPADSTECLVCILGLGCPAGMDATSCQACVLGGGGGGTGDLLCTGGAPDGTCDAMEDPTTCASDCP